ncbi:MAG: epoxide hydrolase family protein [Microterricola sp.]
MAAFTISIPSDVLEDLRSRLLNTRYSSPSASGWEAGTDAGYLRSLLDYWAHDFDWAAAEARLNGYPQFIERGQHFVHVRRDPTRPPVLLAHGWPSSFIEMLPLSELLDVDVVIPSLPGFLFSELPQGPATRASIAEEFHLLMTETLGYERYFAFGGDIGGVASSWLATLHPEHLAGLHMTHGPFPADFEAGPITAEEQAFLDAEPLYDAQDGGYSAIMGTRPDTIAAALADSPAGLAAWIIDKYRAWSDCDGDLESRFDKDTLCTILTLYWATECIGTSFRQYLDYPHNGPRPTITVPVAVTVSHEPGMSGFVRSIAERAASDIRHYSSPGRGGHFLAWEEPALIAGELSAFMRSVVDGSDAAAKRPTPPSMTPPPEHSER